MKTNQMWIAFVAIVLCASCNTAEDFKAEEPEPEITSVEYHQFGGMLEYSEKWTVTSDSIHYTFYKLTTTGGNISKELHAATPEELWSRLQDNCNFSVFSKIEDGESWPPIMDGTDILYTVKTSAGEHTVTNGQGDNYRQLSGFFELILEQVALCQEKATPSENPGPKPPEYPELDGDIKSIDYHHFGGELMYSEKLTVTPDSIHYVYYTMTTTGGDIRKELHVATPEELWSRLQENCDLSAFSKIEDGESRRPYDGTDEVYTVKTSTGERAVTNGQGDNYEQLSGFFELMEEQLDAIRARYTNPEEYPQLANDIQWIQYGHWDGSTRISGTLVVAPNYSESLTITPDSIHYSYYVSSRVATDKQEINKELHVATPEGLWNKLLENFNLPVFSKVKSGKVYDEISTSFTVATPIKERRVTNGYGDSYEQLSGFFELILEQVALYREKATP